MTDEQLAKAERLRAQAGFGQVAYRKAYIQDTGLAAASCDAVISNGVISKNAQGAAARYGVKSVSLVAFKE